MQRKWPQFFMEWFLKRTTTTTTTTTNNQQPTTNHQPPTTNHQQQQQQQHQQQQQQQQTSLNFYFVAQKKKQTHPWPLPGCLLCEIEKGLPPSSSTDLSFEIDGKNPSLTCKLLVLVYTIQRLSLRNKMVIFPPFQNYVAFFSSISTCWCFQLKHWRCLKKTKSKPSMADFDGCVGNISPTNAKFSINNGFWETTQKISHPALPPQKGKKNTRPPASFPTGKKKLRCGLLKSGSSSSKSPAPFR